LEMPKRAVLGRWRIVPGEKAFQNGRRIAGRRLCNGNWTGDRQRNNQGVEASSRLIILMDCASLRRTDVLAVDTFVIVSHPECRSSGDDDVRDGFERNRHTNTGKTAIPADNIDAARPERWRFRQSPFHTHELAIVGPQEDRAFDQQEALAPRLEHPPGETVAALALLLEHAAVGRERCA